MRPIVRVTLIIALMIVSTSTFAQSLSDLYNAASSLVKVYQAATISDEELRDYMQQTMQEMDAENHCLSASNNYSKRLARITKGLTSANGMALNFKVYNDAKTVNAFASPDGSVRVYSGLMDIMSDNEIRGVIGHEIGHVAKRHSLKQLKTKLLASAARDGLMLTNGKLAVLAASQLGALSEVLLTAHYSRVQETEADEYGYQFLKKGGYSPMGMIDALEKLHSIEKDTSNKYVRYALTLFSSHPDIVKRIEHLCDIANEDGYTCKE